MSNVHFDNTLTFALPLREIHPEWDYRLVAASIAVSFIGAFTSTQLMCSARVAKSSLAVFVWIAGSSFVFGFCGIWALHEVAMLACVMDVHVGIDPLRTILSALLATIFTFAALGSGPFQERFREKRRKDRRSWLRRRQTEQLECGAFATSDEERPSTTSVPDGHYERNQNTELYLEEDENDADTRSDSALLSTQPSRIGRRDIEHAEHLGEVSWSEVLKHGLLTIVGVDDGSDESRNDNIRSAAGPPALTRYSTSATGASATSFGMGHVLRPRSSQATGGRNILKNTLIPLWAGCTIITAIRGFWWSLALISMHYVGMLGLMIPEGYILFQPVVVLLSALISWVVCCIGCILMAHMETHLMQQLLFSIVATSGVAAMHFTGMRAASFMTALPPTNERGYPPQLAVAVATVAIVTCLAANFLLAHNATVSRDKFAEVVLTRRELWRTIAQKEAAETAAIARSDFIASASHEIRTPLHHLQGYSDLLSRTELSDEGRLLLQAIQSATRTLSSITNNVLDWSRIENDSEATYRPTDLDIRAVCDSVMNLLPANDDDAEVEMFVVVTQAVPKTIFLDEAYLNRVLMNLLSNALKFTAAGYILLLVEYSSGDLTITVKDSGCGIPPNFVPHMFEPFKQAQTRSTSRGTGLGLSIIRQLLNKMSGTIDVVSNYEKDVPEGDHGTTFTVTIPITHSIDEDPQILVLDALPKVAILRTTRNARSLEGQCFAWQKAGFMPSLVDGLDDLTGNDWRYVCAADTASVSCEPSLRGHLSNCVYTVLLPFDTQNELRQLAELTSLQHVVPIQKPLRWHTFDARVASSKNKPTTPTRVRFAPDETSYSGATSKHSTSPSKVPARRFTILLAEDNPIDQRLGRKMLASLGHDVIVAEDGQDAINKIKPHGTLVDAILMDQSMPRKDGAEATREIRALEKDGILKRRHPIIAVTAVVAVNAQTMCREAGMDDFLAKPLSLAKLESTLSVYFPVNG